MITESQTVREGAIFVERKPLRRKPRRTSPFFGKPVEKEPPTTISISIETLKRYKNMACILEKSQKFYPLLIFDRIRECTINDHLSTISQDILYSYNNSEAQIRMNTIATDLEYFKQYEEKYHIPYTKIIALYLSRRSYDDAYKILRKQNKKSRRNFKNTRTSEVVQVYIKIDRRAYRFFAKKAKNPAFTRYIIEDYLTECYFDERIFLVDVKKIFYPMKFIPCPDYRTRGVRFKIYQHALEYFDFCANQLGITRTDFMRAYLEACAKYRADEHAHTANGFIGVDFDEAYRKELYTVE